MEQITFCRDGSELGCQPTVGRWGNEWPSWLKNAQQCIQNLTEVGGEWPEGHPLPLPRWGCSKQSLFLTSVEEYEELAQFIQQSVQHVLLTHNYNTFGNFIRLVFVITLFNNEKLTEKSMCIFTKWIKTLVLISVSNNYK